MPKPTDKGNKNNSLEPIEGTIGNDENLNGTDGDDTINGLAGNDTIDGLAGNDTIHGGDGKDYIIGGSGDDSLFGESGDDVFIGGAGSDTIDGGDGIDTVTYDGIEGVDYTVQHVTETTYETQGKGRNREIIEVEFSFIEISAADGTVDRLTNVENITFWDTPIVTQNDYIKIDTATSNSATIDVLSNDYYSVSYEEKIYGSGLEIVGISDVGTSGLIPVGTDFSDFRDEDGVQLSDGSLLRINEDGSLTFTAPPSISSDTVYSFQYTASHGGIMETDTVTFNVSTGPTQTLTLEAEAVTEEQSPAGPYYVEGAYAITQLTQALLFGVTVESRDTSAQGYDYDYDGDGDDEWRVWTEDDGSVHEMNVTTLNNAEASLDLNFSTSPNEEFFFESFVLTGLGANEGLTVQYLNADGTVLLGSDSISSLSDLADDGETFNSTYEGPIGQVTFSADTGTEVYIDDMVFL